MTWNEAMTFVEDLNYMGYDDWRLPEALYPGDTPCVGDNCLETEALSLFIYDGISKNEPEPFLNLQDSYWTKTEDPDDATMARSYSTDGTYGNTEKTESLYVWPVRDGDLTPVSLSADSTTDQASNETISTASPITEKPGSNEKSSGGGCFISVMSLFKG